MSGERENTHGPAVFIVGCTMKAWAEESPTITEAAVNFIVLLVRDKKSGAYRKGWQRNDTRQRVPL